MTKTQHAAVCGAGRMGTAIGSAMLRLGYTVSAVNNNPDNLSHFWHVNRGCPTYGHWADLPGKPDVLISALPYHATKAAAEWCLANGVRYCDLGGSVPTSEEIKGLATKAATVPVMTNLGLAPGWINLIAEELYAQLPGATKVEMMVGGIPETRVEADPLNYMLTWSVNGLLNEYRDDCEILLENEVHIVRGLSMCKNVMVAGLDLEAFCTSGASAQHPGDAGAGRPGVRVPHAPVAGARRLDRLPHADPGPPDAREGPAGVQPAPQARHGGDARRSFPGFD